MSNLYKLRSMRREVIGIVINALTKRCFTGTMRSFLLSVLSAFQSDPGMKEISSLEIARVAVQRYISANMYRPSLCHNISSRRLMTALHNATVFSMIEVSMDDDCMGIDTVDTAGPTDSGDNLYSSGDEEYDDDNDDNVAMNEDRGAGEDVVDDDAAPPKPKRPLQTPDKIEDSGIFTVQSFPINSIRTRLDVDTDDAIFRSPDAL